MASSHLLKKHYHHSLTSVLSMNAAISASVVLASRLRNDTSVFALMLFSIQLFALFPILRIKIMVGVVVMKSHSFLTDASTAADHMCSKSWVDDAASRCGHAPWKRRIWASYCCLYRCCNHGNLCGARGLVLGSEA